MKKIFLLLITVFSVTFTYANTENVEELIAKGNKVFVEVIDVKNNIKEEQEMFVEYLNGDEWGKWDLVENKEDADFVCKLTLEKKGAGVSFSVGARVEGYVEICTVDDKNVWTSKKQKGNTNEFTGYNALKDIMRKVIRRSLTKELYAL